MSTIFLADYDKAVAETDVLDKDDLIAVQHGLFGEVGGIMSTAKKLVRERSAYPDYLRSAQEEFGDTLWYLAALCRRVGVPFASLFAGVADSPRYEQRLAASDLKSGALTAIAVPRKRASLDPALAELGRAAADLLASTPTAENLHVFARHYIDALEAADLRFADVVTHNLQKAVGAFVSPKPGDLEDFDSAFEPEEQLPRDFRIRVSQRASGRTYLQWKGVFIGDPLTDNIADRDGYRFHDVFHFAYAAILHWSPVTRALIKHKRKSVPEYDEEQDSGRAIVVEEGVTAWIFSKAKHLHYFEGQEKVSLGILKTIQSFVAGFEVDRCPLKLWEQAILEGYATFRQLRDAEGGYIVGDRAARTLRYEALEGHS